MKNNSIKTMKAKSVNKRVFWFLLVCLIIALFTTLIPKVEQSYLQESKENSIPNSSPTGYQALYRLFQKVSLEPVSMYKHSMMMLNPENPKTIWIIEPDKAFFFDDPYYAKKLNELVQRGYHLVFLLNSKTISIKSQEYKQDTSISYLNELFGLNLKPGFAKMNNSDTIWLNSYFSTRKIKTLHYNNPQSTYSKWASKYKKPNFVYFTPQSLSDQSGEHFQEAKTLFSLSRYPDYPMAIRYKIGKGSVSVFANSFYFQNAQLKQGENAALATALLEVNPEQPVYFEVYSNGFHDRQGFLLTLASGKGLPFLLTCLILLMLFCYRIIINPEAADWDREKDPQKENATRFSQQHFTDALSNHYLRSEQWQALYQKLRAPLQAKFENAYPTLSKKEYLSAIAQNPFYDVSLEELELLFDNTPIQSKAEFEKRGKQVIEISRKVQTHHERV